MEEKKVSIKCPRCKKGQGIVHHRRNDKIQYKCQSCTGYFTNNSNHKRTAISHEFDEFLDAYSKQYRKSLKKPDGQKKVSLASIIHQFPKLYSSQKTLYRNKRKIDVLVRLEMWFRNSGAFGKREYNNFRLKVWGINDKGRSVPTVEISISAIINTKDDIKIKFKVAAYRVNQVNDEGREYVLPYDYSEKDVNLLCGKCRLFF